MALLPGKTWLLRTVPQGRGGGRRGARDGDSARENLKIPLVDKVPKVRE